jgi:5-formyltetrahydrofolate cyclo-ligase
VVTPGKLAPEGNGDNGPRPTDRDPPPTAHSLKKELRSVAKRARAEAFARHGPRASRAIAAHGLDFLGDGGQTPSLSIVSGFMAIGEEIDPAPLMDALHREGLRLALPRMQGKGLPLSMRAWAPGEPLEETMWGIREPALNASEVAPDVVLVPLLAFDASGWRLGYGGGFYDRTLAGLRRDKPVVAVGLAYDEQRVDQVPHDSHDQPLDWVLTPSGAVKCRRES